MAISIHHCWNCGKRITHAIEEHFFFCDMKCMEEKEAADLEARKKERESAKFPADIFAGSLNASVSESVEDEIEKPRGFLCTHKNNCAAHREICIAKHGVTELGGRT